MNSIGQENLPKLDVPFEPTHQKVVDAMLQLANIKNNDILYDLGCGDGRILIDAARRYCVRGVGIDIDPQRIREARENAAIYGVADKVQFIIGDIMEVNFSEATVVTLYLLDRINIRIRPLLIQQLKSGTRVVSHAFGMGYWEPDSVVTHPKARNNKIYLWVIPAPIGGKWSWATDFPTKDTQWNLQFNQEFQGATCKLVNPKYPVVSIGDVNLSGQKLQFETELQINGKKTKIVYRGIVTGDTIRGTQQCISSQWAGIYTWEAVRKPVSLIGIWEGKTDRLHSSDSEFKLCLQKLNNGILQADYISNKFNLSDLPFYAWGANIWFEINGLTYKGFIDGESINGSIRSEDGTNNLNWSAYRKN